ncbi:MAG: helix-turn-helix transcriptional regulator [Methanomassiliicoccales archaeon]
MDELTRYLEGGLFRPYVIWLCSKGPVSGTDVLEAEKMHSHYLSPGKLYPVLHQLLEDGLLEEEIRVEHGKVHKYYTATEKGRLALEQLKSELGPPMKDFLFDWLVAEARS